MQQESLAETSEGTGINSNCSHTSIQAYYIQWYSQFPGQGPTFLISAFKGSKEIPDKAESSALEDCCSNTLWLARPPYTDAAVYYYTLVAQGEEPRLWPVMNCFGSGRGKVLSRPAGDAACRATKPC